MIFFVVVVIYSNKNNQITLFRDQKINFGTFHSDSDGFSSNQSNITGSMERLFIGD
jgi:hypothetical protein